jgi:anti-sigma B factor antagonist
MVVVAEGEIDIATSPGLDQVLDAAISSGHTNVAVDLQGVTFMDSTGLRSLIASHRRIGELGGAFVVVAAAGPARRLLELAGVVEVLQVVASVDDLATP